MSKNAELMSTAPSSCFVRDTCVHPCGMHRLGTCTPPARERAPKL